MTALATSQPDEYTSPADAESPRGIPARGRDPRLPNLDDLAAGLGPSCVRVANPAMRSTTGKATRFLATPFQNALAAR
jgi:hypothetical protein